MAASLSIDDIVRMITGRLPGVDADEATEQGGAPAVAWGDRFLYYDPKHILESTKKFPFATIVIKDYPGWDEASNVNRPGVFRLNIGLGKTTFDSLFDGDGATDYTVLDTLLPHPVYAKNHWVCVLSPSAATIEQVWPLIEEAHAMSKRRYHGGKVPE